MLLRPTKWLIRILLLWAVIGLAASFWDPATGPWKIFGAILCGLAVFDAVVSLLTKNLLVQRTLPGRLALGVEGEVTVRILNPTALPVTFSLYDGIPAKADCRELPWTGVVQKGGYLDVVYPVTLHERGETTFGKTHVLQASLLRFWNRQIKAGKKQITKVYPNYQPVLRYALLAMEQRQEHTGIVRKNRAGLSRDFHQLRDYQMGDSMVQIDWKASSKRQSLISRDFQEQRDQSVILMVDSGRRMRTMEGELTQFDHCLNSMLLVSYVALRQGDHVGILSFGGTDRWLPPVKGSHAMTTILNHLYDYETAPFPSDFSEAAQRLLTHQQKRALVIVLTNMRGEESEELRDPLRKLRQKHAVVFANLRESGIDDMLNDEVQTFDDALGYLAAKDYAREREQTLLALQTDGIITIDETAQNLPVAIANCYLDTREMI